MTSSSSLLNSLNVHSDYKTNLVSLFIEGQPIVFEVHKKHQVFYFEPLSSWKDPIAAESFSLERQDATWISTIALDNDLFYQAIEEVEKLL